MMESPAEQHEHADIATSVPQDDTPNDSKHTTGSESAEPCASQRKADWLRDSASRFLDVVRSKFPPEFQAACMQQLDEKLRGALQAWWLNDSEPWSLYLFGPSSRGKTHAAFALAAWIFERHLDNKEKAIRSGGDSEYQYGHLALDVFPSYVWPDNLLTGLWGRDYPAQIGTGQFLRLEQKAVTGRPVLRRNYERVEPSDVSDPLDAFANHPGVLVLDDFGTERHTEFRMETLYELINTRYEKRLPTIITSNTDIRTNPDDDRYVRLLERFRQGQAIEVQGKNWRWTEEPEPRD